MKTVVVRRIKDGAVVEEMFKGPDVNWSFDNGIFRIWTKVKTLAVPYEMLESVEINHLNA